MKRLIYFIILLALICSVNALDECAPTIEPLDVPCLVTSTWKYPGLCSSHNSTVYDSEGNNILNYTFIDLNSSGFCYYVWNISALGSYIHYTDLGDQGSITVSGEMQQIFNLSVFALYMLAQFVLIYFIHKFKDDQGTALVYGLIASVFSFIMIALLLSGFQVFQGITFIIDINYYLILLIASIGIYTSILSYIFYGDVKFTNKTEAERERY